MEFNRLIMKTIKIKYKVKSTKKTCEGNNTLLYFCVIYCVISFGTTLS